MSADGEGAPAAASQPPAEESLVSLSNLYLVLPRSTYGRLVVTATRANFKVAKKAEITTLCKASDVERVEWTPSGPKTATLSFHLTKAAPGAAASESGEPQGEADDEAAHAADELPVTGPPALVRVSNLSRSDERSLRDVFEKTWRVPWSSSKLDARGLNFGTLQLQREERLLRLVAHDNQDAATLELPLVGVAQAANPGKNEIEIQYAPTTKTGPGLAPADDATDHFELVVVRFAVPSNEDGSDVADQVLHRIQAVTSSTEEMDEALLCELPEEIASFLNPRGRFRLEFYKELFHMRGKTYDFKVRFASITQLFLLDRPEGGKYLVISLDAPIRQGQQRYPHLVVSLDDVEEEVSLRMTKEEIATTFAGQEGALQLAPTMSGSRPETVAKLFKGFSGKKVFVVGDGGFKSHTGAKMVKAALKTNQGLLYPLKRQFVFVHKPVLFIRYDSVKEVEVLRTSGDNKTWDLSVATKASGGDPGTVHVFQQIAREDLPPLLRFLDTLEDVKVVNKKQLLEELKRGTLTSAAGRARSAAAGGGQTLMDLDEGSDDEEDSNFEEDSDGSGDDSGSGSGSGGGGGGGGGDDDDGSSSSGSGSDEDSDMAELVSIDADELGGEADGEAVAGKRKRAGAGSSSEPGAGAARKKPKKASGNEDGDAGEGDGRKKQRKKDPNAPKKPLSAYFIFIRKEQARFKEEGSSLDFAARAKALSEKWKSLSAEEKGEFERQAEEDKERYKREMAEYRAKNPNAADDDAAGGGGGGGDGDDAAEDGGGKGKRRKKDAVKDPNRPKRPVAAYQYYIKSKTEEVKQYPQKDRMGVIAGWWRALSDEDKAPFVEMASKDKARYDEAMRTYVPPAGADGKPAKKQRRASAKPAAAADKAAGAKAAKVHKLEKQGAGLAASSSDDDSSSDDSSDDSSDGDADHDEEAAGGAREEEDVAVADA